MSKYLVAVAVLAGLLALGGGHAQEGSAQKNKRLVYVVKHGDAKDLAGALAKHFKDEAEVQALPESPSNCLLISASPAVFEEVVKVLEQLDRRPQLVSVEVQIVEVLPKKGKDGKPVATELDDKDFTGPARDVLKKVDALKKDGALGSLRSLHLNALENRPTSTQVGETKPTVSGVTTTATGVVTRRILYHSTGTKVDLTARVAPENVVALDLTFQDTRLFTPEDGVEIGKDEKNMPIRATEIVMATVKAKLTVAADQAVAVQGVKTESKSGQSQTLIIVTARPLDPPKGGK